VEKNFGDILDQFFKDFFSLAVTTEENYNMQYPSMYFPRWV